MMKKFQTKFNQMVYGMKGTKGATMVEYALLLFLILVVAYIAFQKLGSSVSTAATSANNAFSS